MQEEAWTRAIIWKAEGKISRVGLLTQLAFIDLQMILPKFMDLTSRNDAFKLTCWLQELL